MTSREKQLSRWYQNEQISYAVPMLPFVQLLLAGLATHTLVLVVMAAKSAVNVWF